MITLSTNYTLKWRFKHYQNLQITTCKRLINVKTMRLKKKCVNGGVIGYWLSSKKFIPLTKINDLIEIIPNKSNCPF
jgi:hypothetical protein